MGQDILGPLHGLKDFALSSTQIGRSWNLSRQPANPPTRQPYVVSRSERHDGAGGEIPGCLLQSMWLPDARTSLSAAASAPCRMVWGAHLPPPQIA
ncbi:hypothetical protein HBI23_101100 [Parastagonospora nodorum]|nr:hypothetical protein HBH81_150880 [Parastagonospora nodorum]KAH5662448.1 hypothetical protein HBI23_101100 [Parastagonospora nodorum]KAH5697331.1 hypothetical protein HBI44_098090 [Parastagonospora nodorum]